VLDDTHIRSGVYRRSAWGLTAVFEVRTNGGKGINGFPHLRPSGSFTLNTMN